MFLSFKNKRNNSKNKKNLFNILRFLTGLYVSSLESSVNVDDDIRFLTEESLSVDRIRLLLGKSSSELKKEEMQVCLFFL